MKKCLVLAVSILLLAACTSKQDKLFKQAQLATDKGEFTKAIQLYTAVLKQNPKHIAARTNRGVLFERLKTKSARERLKNQKLAEQDYVKALEGAPNVPKRITIWARSSWIWAAIRTRCTIYSVPPISAPNILWRG